MNESQLKIIADSLGVSLQELIKTMPRAESSALRKAGALVRSKTRKKFVSMLPMARHHGDMYNDTLQDAVRYTKVRDGKLVVHVMGTHKKGSGTFRTRFFEGGTKDRYQRKINGKPLKTPRFIGRIRPMLFFGQTMDATQSELVNAMDDQLQKYIKKAWNR